MATTLLVTGGAGFIGGCFVRQAIGERGDRVVNLDKLTYAGNLDSLEVLREDRRHVFVRGCVTDGALVEGLLREHRPSARVHFSADSHVDRSIDGPRAFLEANVVGPFELLAAATSNWEGLDDDGRGTFQFIHVSTDEVFGSLGPAGKFTEETPYDPRSPYSASKAASDRFVPAFFQTYGLPTLVTNRSNNYGLNQFPENLIPLVLLNSLEGRPLLVYGDGRQVRDWLFVEDHCRALRRMLEAERPGETYNIDRNTERTNLQDVETICATIDDLRPSPAHRACRSLICFVPDRPGHDRCYAIDAAKIADE